MSRIAELVPGERVVLETDRHDLDFDRRSGTLRLVHRPLLRRARERVIPLESIHGMRIRWSERTAVTWSRSRMVREITANSPETAEAPRDRRASSTRPKPEALAG
jgi:hypothetical protein